MVSSVIGDVSALRWQLPVKTPSDEAQQDRMECQTIDAQGKLMRETLPEAPRVAHASLSQGGDHADPEAAPNMSFTPNSAFTIASGDADGRAAVKMAYEAMANTARDQ